MNLSAGRRYFAAVILFLCVSPLPSAAATDYEIILSQPDQHLLEVHIELPPGSPVRELQLPVWNAIYQVRDFSQYVNWIRAKDRAGRWIAVRQLDKSRWEVSGTQDGAIVEYQIFADAPGPFGAQLNPHHAFFNLAQVLMYPADVRDQTMRLHFSTVPQGWKVATPLSSPTTETYTADNYDRLVDSPVELGNFQESDFDQGGGHYRVIVDADPGTYDMQTIVGTLEKIVASATNWMGDRPFESYMFIYHFPRGPAGGGMEHAYSTAIDLSSEALSGAPVALASVTAHEFFHLWNVKRIRPQGLAPVDYTKENYTRALWFSEGCTSSAADFIRLRSGLMNEREFEKQLGADISELESRPAHLTQSAEESSLDAWLEGDAYYRRPERSISYYNKGELLGILLDLAVRDASNGKASLREVFQRMNMNYAKKGIPFPESDGILASAEAVSGANLKPFFEKYVQGTEEIPWNDFFRSVGLNLAAHNTSEEDAGFTASRNFDGPMTVTQVNAGSEAEHAGLRIGDVVLQINGRNVGEDSSKSLAGLSAGDLLTLKLRGRRGDERELKWKVGSREVIAYDLEDIESITPEQRARRTAWLKGEAQSSKQGSERHSDSTQTEFDERLEP
jgi:predicted metalloprotease with PDZ domain